MTVGTHLSNTAGQLVLSSAELASIETSISTLSSRLSSYFDTSVSSKFQFGSSMRGTILPRSADSRSDIDYMIVFDTSTETMKPQTYIAWLKKFAETKYASSEIKQSHPTIVLSLSHISFELVPAVYEYGYKIPSPSSSFMEWTYTDPTRANKDVQDKNIANNSLIKPLVRLVKYWNAYNGYCYTSYSLEQLVISKYYYPNNSLKEMFFQFWESFSANYNDSQATKDKVERAKSRIASAKYYEQVGQPLNAETEIKKVIPPL
jgi:hypothetical protein